MLGAMAVACGPCALAAGPGIGGEQNAPIPGLKFKRTVPARGLLYEHFGARNRLNGKVVCANGTGQTLTLTGGKAFFLDRQGSLMGTYTMTDEDIAERVSSGAPALLKGWQTVESSLLPEDSSFASVNDLARWSDSRMAAAGSVRIEGVDYQLLLLLDTSGVTKAVTGPGGSASSVAWLPLGGNAVYTAGTVGWDTVPGYVIARFDPEGNKIPFPEVGDVILSRYQSGNADATGEAVAVNGKGEIWVAGRSEQLGVRRLAVARHLPSGLYDPEWNGVGVQVVDVPAGQLVRVCEIVPDSEGRLLVLFLTLGADGTRSYLARMTAAGELDPGFGTGGFQPLLISGKPGFQAERLDVNPGGLIAIAGSSDSHFAAMRLSGGTGALDASYGGQGWVITDFLTMTSEWATGVAWLWGDRITLVGSGRNTATGHTDMDLLLAQHTADGALEAAFHHDGKVRIAGLGEFEDLSVRDAVRLLDDSVLVAGVAFEGKDQYPFFARFDTSGRLVYTLPSGSDFTLDMMDFPFFVDVNQSPTSSLGQPYEAFSNKATPAKLNLQLQFAEYDQPFVIAGLRPILHESPAYRFPLGHLPSGMAWSVSQSHEAGKNHPGNPAQRYAYDIVAWNPDTESSLRPVSGEELADLNAQYAALYPDLFEDGKTFAAASFNESYLAYGQPVLAIALGKVVWVENVSPQNFPKGSSRPPEARAGGNSVILDHGNGEFSFYAHMITGSVKVKLGDVVQPGQELGLLGNSGDSSGPHLHFNLVDGYDPDDDPSQKDGLPVYFNNIAFNADPVVGGAVWTLRSSLRSGALVWPVHEDFPLAPWGPEHGPGLVQDIAENQGFTTAQRLKLPAIVSGRIRPSQPFLSVDGGDPLEDHFRFELTVEQIVTARLQTTDDVDLDVLVYDANLRVRDPGEGRTPANSEFWQARLGPGAYYVAVSRDDHQEGEAPASYVLKLSADYPLAIKPEPNATGGVSLRLQWALEGDGYGIEVTDSLENGGRWEPLELRPEPTPEGRSLLLPAVQAARFYRLTRSID